MSELKPCPFCGGAPAVIEDGYKAIAVHCFNCGADITAETERKACAAWNRRAQPANEPLTLDELRGMDGEPVWVKEITPEPIDGDYWGLVDPDFVCVDGYGVGAVLSTATDGKSRFAQTPLSDYGKTWLAYRRKPEPEGGAEK